MSLLIAESGGSKTDWFFAPDTYFQTTGLNPNLLSATDFETKIRQEVLPQIPSSNAAKAIRQLYFYSAGCSQESMQRALCQRFSNIFSHAEIEVQSDLMAAARALSGNTPALIILLGTGAHAGVYDGKKIIQEATNLGYLLGDECSGADLGKEILRAYLYQRLPAGLQEEFEQEFGLISRQEFIERMYREAPEVAWLARFSRFVTGKQKHPYLRELLQSRLDLFLDTHIMPLLQEGGGKLPVFAVGGISKAIEVLLNQTLRARGTRLSGVLQQPLSGLVSYHNANYVERWL